MRIEILVDNEEPRIYPLDRPKIVVGSHESCDVIIAQQGISRKHLVIFARDDKYFVADQGSTNGSYINELRLVPGSTTEFTSFFPVRLGDNVLVTLLSDDAAKELGPESSYNNNNAFGAPVENESTKMISLKDLRKSNTQDLVKKRTETVTKRKTSLKTPVPQKKKTSTSNSRMGMIVLLLFAGAAYYQIIMNKKSDPEAIVASPEKIVPQEKVIIEAPIERVDESALPSVELIIAAINNPKCKSDIEKYLCTTLPLIYQEKWGTVLIDKTVVIMADGIKYASIANEYVKAPLPVEEGGTKVAVDAYNLDRGLIMLMAWMNDNIPAKVKTLEGMKELSITVAFVNPSKEGASLVSASVIDSDFFLRLRQKIQEKHFTDAKKNGALEFAYAHEYLRFL